MKAPCIYILASKRDGALYVGVTSDLNGRMAEHDQKLIEGFTKRYGVTRLVYYEFHDDMAGAIAREKQLKEWRRAWKVRLVEGMNAERVSLFDDATGEIAASPAVRRVRGHSDHLLRLAWIPACAGMTEFSGATVFVGLGRQIALRAPTAFLKL